MTSLTVSAVPNRTDQAYVQRAGVKFQPGCWRGEGWLWIPRGVHALTPLDPQQGHVAVGLPVGRGPTARALGAYGPPRVVGPANV